MSPILLDSIIGIIILLSVVFAFFRGFVREMLTIVNLAGAAAAGYFLAPAVKPRFDEWLAVPKEGQKAELIWGAIPPEIMSAFLSYACPFFGVFFILTLAGLYISGTIKALGLGPVDKMLGVAFGALRGFLLVFLFYLPFAYLMPREDYPRWAQESISVAMLDDAYKAAQEYMNTPENGEAPSDEEIDPNSLAGKMKKAADDLAQQKRDLDAQIKQEVKNGNLTPEEVNEYRNDSPFTNKSDYQ